MTKGRHGLFLQAADPHDPTAEGDFTGHGNVPPHRGVGQGGDHGRADRYTGRGAVLGNRALREVDVDVLGLIKVSGNAQPGGIGPNVTQRCMSRLLHHIPQIAGELQLAGAVHDVNFYLQGLAAYTGPGQTGHKTYLIRSGQPVRQELPDT